MSGVLCVTSLWLPHLHPTVAAHTQDNARGASVHREDRPCQSLPALRFFVRLTSCSVDESCTPNIPRDMSHAVEVECESLSTDRV